jgi:hypothetical protein
MFWHFSWLNCYRIDVWALNNLCRLNSELHFCDLSDCNKTVLSSFVVVSSLPFCLFWNPARIILLTFSLNYFLPLLLLSPKKEFNSIEPNQTYSLYTSKYFLAKYTIIETSPLFSQEFLKVFRQEAKLSS